MFKKKYPSLSFWENFLGGHVSIGPVTIFGENAMHWAVNIKTKRFGYICFRLPLRCFGVWWPLYFYCSPNGTPSKTTLAIKKSLINENYCLKRELMEVSARLAHADKEIERLNSEQGGKVTKVSTL